MPLCSFAIWEPLRKNFRLCLETKVPLLNVAYRTT